MIVSQPVLHNFFFSCQFSHTDLTKRSIPPQCVGIFTRGLDIDKNDVKQDPVNTAKWFVKSQNPRSENLIYVVKRRARMCLRDICANVAAPCMHRYICSCLHTANPCKHIVKVHSLDAPNEVTRPESGKDCSFCEFAKNLLSLQASCTFMLQRTLHYQMNATPHLS